MNEMATEKLSGSALFWILLMSLPVLAGAVLVINHASPRPPESPAVLALSQSPYAIFSDPTLTVYPDEKTFSLLYLTSLRSGRNQQSFLDLLWDRGLVFHPDVNDRMTAGQTTAIGGEVFTTIHFIAGPHQGVNGLTPAINVPAQPLFSRPRK